MTNTVLLTGCIKPPSNVPFLKITNENERYYQYIQSIINYITQSDFDNIIFCENSNYKIEHIETINNLCKIYNKNFELLQFLGNDKTQEKGRGYGENQIIEFAINNSNILKTAKNFYKITGRYRVKNINKILKDNSHNSNIFFKTSFFRKACNTAFFRCDTDFFKKYLIGAGEQVDDKAGVSLETVYFDRIYKHKNKFNSTKVYPIFIGVNGCGGLLLDKKLDSIKTIVFNKLGLYKI